MKIKKSIFVYILLILVVIAVGISFLLKNGEFNTVEVQRGDFVQVTETAGKVIPAEELDFSFEVPGRVIELNVNVGDEVMKGDVLVRLDSSEVQGEIDEALASLRSEEVKLSEISGGNSASQSRLDSVRNTLISTLKKSYITADDVIRNSVDSFITDANTTTPDFDLSLGDYFLRQDIEDLRVGVENTLRTWEQEVSSLSVSAVSLSDAEEAIRNLKQVESLLSLISSGGDEFSPTNSTTQSQIDAYISGISAGRTSISSMIVDINSKTESVRDAEADIPITEAAIDSANAKIEKLSAKREKYVIRAPFDGIVTLSEIEIGQVISAGELVLSMISSNGLEVEAFIPEVNIAGVNVGDKATLTFDAFGEDEEFFGTISHVDPRETIKDGVTTYKILIEFDSVYEEIFSGMTSEIVIEKTRQNDQILIPIRLVEKEGGNSYVNILKNGVKEEREIEIGMSDGRGNIIVKSGLEAGELIIEE